MKPLIQKCLPGFVQVHYRQLKRKKERRRYRHKSEEKIFTEIYMNNRWGGTKNTFCSGPGTVNQEVVSPYISMISTWAKYLNFQGGKFIDLGCGDFSVGRQLLPLCSDYTGVDIVKPLVERNQSLYANVSTRFIHLNIAEDELPEGDVCFIRQVFQHLPNCHILSALKKLCKYKWVFITEHYPTDNEKIVPNKDKIAGSDVRVYKNSGVYLTHPPFKLPAESIQEVLEVPGVGLGQGHDQGVIRTFLYHPQTLIRHPLT